jgi:hypothetical protein
MIRNRLRAASATNDPGCPWYNPFCLFVPADDPNACYGGGPLIDVQACVSANNAVTAQMAQSQPAAAQDYASAATGDVLDIVNPFTGTGPLAAASVPTWVWVAGATIVGVALLGGRR